MSDEEYRLAVQILIVAGWTITGLVWLGYTAVAPWYLASAGRYIWGLLTSLVGLFSVFMGIIILDDFAFRRELILIVLTAYAFAMLGMGIGIYRAQVVRYYKAKAIQRKKSNK